MMGLDESHPEVLESMGHKSPELLAGGRVSLCHQPPNPHVDMDISPTPHLTSGASTGNYNYLAPINVHLSMLQPLITDCNKPYESYQVVTGFEIWGCSLVLSEGGGGGNGRGQWWWQALKTFMYVATIHSPFWLWPHTAGDTQPPWVHGFPARYGCLILCHALSKN